MLKTKIRWSHGTGGSPEVTISATMLQKIGLEVGSEVMVTVNKSNKSITIKAV